MRQRWRARQPACLHGHPFPENLFYNSSGYAQCRTCVRVYNRTWHERNYIPVTPDEVAIDRAVMGNPPARLTPRERATAIRRLDARGLSARQIAERIGCSQRTVHRVRTRTAR
ncbi:helix-turn-helix domain-containing protein [Streptomyces sp. NPDC013489]|uniref:helix-turn-helix domain-containing protein n=1 Tax=Streptomyces sp. NPDC013489 TaxID=3155606 RepID=UPI0033DC5B7F